MPDINNLKEDCVTLAQGFRDASLLWWRGCVIKQTYSHNGGQEEEGGNTARGQGKI
jgi:hypothetical protein